MLLLLFHLLSRASTAVVYSTKSVRIIQLAQEKYFDFKFILIAIGSAQGV